DIWIQTLVLTDAQARAIEAGLRDSLHQRRRSYVYDHFHDNCTTRIRDLIDDAIGGALRAGSRGAHPLTYRELGKGGLAELPPLIAVADFFLGRALDERPTIWEAMFHPAVLRRQLELQLGVVSRVEHARTQAPFALEGPTGRVPLLVIALASTMVLLAASWRRRFEKPARIVATLYPGTWGLIVWALVALSPIAGLRWNEAALVVMPFDLAIPWLSSARAARYAQIRVAGVLAVAALCAAGVLLQPLWIPILTAILPLSTVAFGARLRRASDRQSAGGRPAGSAA
ncbi:MAG: DUF4105 domain-containing protein, partial [Deltaproteobacteria bacterium]|nr:DUF4105 domain-containing protein [Deltaproteobacteria bacterium]